MSFCSNHEIEMDSRIFQRDFLSFSTYSSLQKLSLFFLVVCLLSCVFSIWTLPFLYLFGVFLGVKISDIIVNQESLNDIIRKVIFEFDTIRTRAKSYLQNKDTKAKDPLTIDSLQSGQSPQLQLTQITEKDENRWTSRKDSHRSTANIPKSITLELNSIQLLIVRDFVNSWFTMFSTNEQFPKEIKQMLHLIFISIAARCYQQRSDTLLIKFLRHYQLHFATFQKAKLTYESHRIAPGTKVSLDNKIKRHSSVDEAFSSLVPFHYAVQSESHELNYMKRIVSLLLTSLAEPPLLQGPCIKTMLIEILTSRVFLPVLNLISDPYWLMEVLIHVMSDEEIVSNEEINSVTSSDDLVEPLNECDIPETNPASSHQSLSTNKVDVNEEFGPLGNSFQSPMDISTQQETLKYYDRLDKLYSNDEHSNHPTDTNELQAFHLNEATSYNKNTISISWPAATITGDIIDSYLIQSTPNLDLVPQTLEKQVAVKSLMFSGSQTVPSTTQQNVSDVPFPTVQESTDENKEGIPSNIDSDVDEMSSSLSKLTSLKNFFVDSLKSGGRQQSIKKPKSLQLFPEQNLTNTKFTDNHHNPPQVFVDGVPEEREVQTSQLVGEQDLTPSSGFFSSMHAWFGLSNSVSQEFTSPIGSPDLTPSPLPEMQFNISDVAVIKDSELDSTKPFLSDDMRIFQDIAISKGFPFRDEKSSSTYSLYIIEYEALYFTEEGKAVIRSGVVKRRYREFVNLQSRLETNPAYKKYLKNIRVPKRWPTLPFKTLDKETVETRRIFLEKYLKDLITNEAICNGPDLREFLAYEGNSHIAFVKKSPDLMVPRIDKMFMRSVSGVMDRIKLLPSLPQEMISGLRGRDSSDEKLALNKNQSDPDNIDCWSDFADEPTQVTDQVNVLVTSCSQLIADDKSEEHFTDFTGADQKWDHKVEVFKQEVEKVLLELQNLDLTHETGSDELDCGVLFELLVQGLQDHWLCRDRVLRSAQSLLSKTLAGAVQTILGKQTTEEKIISYLTKLRETVWPQGQFKSSDPLPMSEEVKAATRAKAKQCLIDLFPTIFQSVVGIQQFEDLIDLFLSSLESQQLNKHVLYSFVDILIEQLFPEVTRTDFLRKLFLQARS